MMNHQVQRYQANHLTVKPDAEVQLLIQGMFCNNLTENEAIKLSKELEPKRKHSRSKGYHLI